jgi:hypothetical protein
MKNPKQINQGGAQIQESQDPQQTGSKNPHSTDDFPTDGPEAQRRREEMQHKEKAEGDRRD